MMKWKADLGRLGATVSHDGPVGNESKSEIRGKGNIVVAYLAPFSHFKNHKQEQRLVRCRITSRTIYPQCGKLMQPVSLILEHRISRWERRFCGSLLC